jgi:hypothetical protein
VSIKSLFACLAVIASDAAPVQPDFAYVDHGSVVLLRPLNRGAWDWVAEHIPPDYSLFGGAIPVERRLFKPILDGINDAGLTYTD